jgi:hypothetical protein
MSKSTWIPQVGEWVVIQKGTDNWNPHMDNYVGKIVQILKVYHYHGKHYHIDFENYGGWTWETQSEHFRKASWGEIENQIKNIPLPRFLKWVANIGSDLTGSMGYQEKFIKGKIFDTTKDTIPVDVSIDRWEEYYKIYPFNFLPSTEKEYEKWVAENKKEESSGSGWRFKTEDEFKRDGLWNYSYECPDLWNYNGKMNIYLGTSIPAIHHSSCSINEGFSIDVWTFSPGDYTNEPLPNPGYLPKKKAHQEIHPQTKSEISIEKPKSSVKEIVVPKSYIPTPDLKRIVIKPVNIKL